MTFQRLCKSILVPLLLVMLLITFTSAKRAGRKGRPLPLTSIHLVDRNGFSETLTHKDRLGQFQDVDFLKPQPYQKVLRIYARDTKGNVRSIVTSYYPNGNPKQFLEILNARAFGNYREWHENGVMSLAVRIIGGQPDITQAAELSWLFDGVSYAWNEEGHLIAEINYAQGVLEGNSTYYHPSGQVWKQIPYHKNVVDGMIQIRKDNGEILQQITYVEGLKQGTAIRYWEPNQIASQEEYVKGKLQSGQYFDKKGTLIAGVVQGFGFRAIFGKESVSELQEYKNGELEGEVYVYTPQGHLKRFYHVKNNIKHGEELEYYDQLVTDANDPSKQIPQPRLSFQWVEGSIQGLARTWYPNGIQESQREMANNAKTGISTAWYRDGNLMMIEEYEKNKLSKGEYFKKGEKTPVSQVILGKGTVTLFDPDGHFTQKVSYVNGMPHE